jgi:hypothetical protein
VDAPALGDWTTVRALERFSGTLDYTADVHLPDWGTPFGPVEVDLGAVGEAAEVHVNGAAQGFAMWAPYRVATAGAAWRPGRNVLEVRVTNSAANAYEGALRPSGLLGPVQLSVQRHIAL